MSETKKSSPLGGGVLSRGGARPPTPVNTAAQKAEMEFVQRFRLPQRIKLLVTLFRTDTRKFPDAQGQDLINEHLKNARDVLDSHNIELVVFPANGVPIDLPFDGGVIDEKQVGIIRSQANTAITRQGFPIIYCPLHDNYQEVKGGGDLILGEKYGGPGNLVDGTEWMTFAIINVRKKSKSGMTLLHEMGHGAGLKHFEGNADTSNFMYLTDTDGPGERRGMLCCQVMAFAVCYFASPQLTPSPEFKKRCPLSAPCRRVFGERWS